jgi:hypothetical protein
MDDGESLRDKFSHMRNGFISGVKSTRFRKKSEGLLTSCLTSTQLVGSMGIPKDQI